MSIVNTAEPITSARAVSYIDQILQACPGSRSETLATTAFRRPIRTLVLGNGPRKVIFSASHHANEWITSLVLLKYAEQLCNGDLPNAKAVLDAATVYMVPMVDPDGVDLVTGAIEPGSIPYEAALQISSDFPGIPFPDGWKANLLGVDLNLQYPAGWMQAREIKFSQGFTRPAPRDYVGRAPLNQIESRAMAGYTEFLEPDLVLALHSQGKLIFWQYADVEVPGARELGERMANVSGYALADTPYESSFAGYKDWFIKVWQRPGYTVEVGEGQSPLPLSQFDEIYAAVAPLLTVAALG